MVDLFGDAPAEDDYEDDFDSKLADVEADLDAEEGEGIVPRTNPDLAGHAAAEAQLLSDFNAGRMPHALILAGPQGIGKATLAYRLVRFLLAQKDEGAGLFGEPEKPTSLYIKPEDPVFRRVASGGHADLLTVEREVDEKKGRLKNDIGVESVRRIAPFLRKTAAEGGWRAVIVDSAEYLNASSQNALLKILEEPPPRSVLILTTSQPGAFLPTIRSRCRTIQLDPLSEADMEALLEKAAPQVEGESLTALLSLAQGSIGRALRHVEEGGVTVYQDLLAAASTLPSLDTALVHDLADKIGRHGAETSYDAAREILSGWCAEAAKKGARGEGAAVPVRLSPRHAFTAWEKMTALFDQTDRYNLDRRLAVLNAFLLLQNPEHQVLNA